MMEFFSSDRIDSFSGEKYEILVEVLGAMNKHPDDVLMTDASQVSDFLWAVAYNDGKVFGTYEGEFTYRFDQMVEKMMLMFDVFIMNDNGCQKTIVDYVDEIYEYRHR